MGRGVAIAERPAAGGLSHSAVTLSLDGTVVVNTSIFEPGTGTNNLLKQIVGEELNLDPKFYRCRSMGYGRSRIRYRGWGVAESHG
ncbi:MAG: hypothetical protein CM1200mP35_00010 [Chloroflexota bacterium]|nr:MAG: hypothetical protein CM1200mP35_00010 [Chloroflexota bacterium]